MTQAPGQLGEAFFHNQFLALASSLVDTHFVFDTDFMEGSLEVIEAGA